MEHLVETLLGILEIRVLKVENIERGDLLIHVGRNRKGAACRYCGRPTEAFHGHDKPVRLRHLPI